MECKDIPFILNNQGLNKKNKKPGPAKEGGAIQGGVPFNLNTKTR